MQVLDTFTVLPMILRLINNIFLGILRYVLLNLWKNIYVALYINICFIINSSCLYILIPEDEDRMNPLKFKGPELLWLADKCEFSQIICFIYAYFPHCDETKLIKYLKSK